MAAANPLRRSRPRWHRPVLRSKIGRRRPGVRRPITYSRRHVRHRSVRNPRPHRPDHAQPPRGAQRRQRRRGGRSRGRHRPAGGRPSSVGRHPHRQHRGPGTAGLLRRRRPQGDQLRSGRRSQHQARRLCRFRLPRAPEAGDRRRRRPGHGRRMRDRARRRPGRRDHPLVVRARRGQAQPDRRCRRAVPPATGHRTSPSRWR